MRIYRMTATFGKLEHETLALEPGLNVIEAPNEWGKSTWCAFFMAMLYGLDTRAKSTKSALADKEKYAPWSGSPMAGRIDLNWNGRDITIERSTKGRTPLGVFRAYETESGLAVPELTAANCGQLLLGAEQSVCRRTAFIRQSDLPVTQDDALRRRLNALVTTGDESGDSDRLAAELKDLKNKCRYNRTGLLPQAEAQRRELEEKLQEAETLQLHSRKIRQRIGEVKTRLQALENHRDALRYAAAEMDARHVAEARDLQDQAEAQLSIAENRCARQPAREKVETQLRSIQSYLNARDAYQAQLARTAAPPPPPVPPEIFLGMTPEQATDMVRKDCTRYEKIRSERPWMTLLALAGAIAVASVLLGLWKGLPLLLPLLALAFAAALLSGKKKRDSALSLAHLEEKYGSPFPDAWKLLLERYGQEKAAYDQALLAYRSAQGDLDIQKTFLEKQGQSLFGSQNPEDVLHLWQEMLKNWDACSTARQEFHRAEKHLNVLEQMAQSGVKKPAMEDSLLYSPAETQALLEEARTELQRLQNRLGQYQGRMEALGDMDALQAQLCRVQERIGRLEETYGALSLALDTLTQARQALQRKFAPRISRQARELLAQMTSGRYDRLTLKEDLSLLAGAGQEDTLREILWRSDGTMDQLYLALRLAVAGELLPDAPLILDDALVRFDDSRLKETLNILGQESARKQVILFTCQHREKEYLSQKAEIQR